MSDGLSDSGIDDLGRGGWALCGIAGAVEVAAYALDPPLTAPLVVHIPLALTLGAFVAGLAAVNFVVVFRLLGMFHDQLEAADES